MSKDLRHEKNCLNCGHEVPERYCSHCGQENTPAHESFGHLTRHFVADVVHYDSKFHTSLVYLLFRPGRLTKEYLAGKRVSYIHPIRLYIFVSFVFFFTAFAINKKEEAHEEKVQHGLFNNIGDSVLTGLQNNDHGGDSIVTQKVAKVFRNPQVHDLNLNPNAFENVHQYDSAQRALPDSLRDRGAERWLNRRMIYLREKYEGQNTTEVFMEMLQHDGPKVMFLLLPLFALLLKGMYNWKRWYYADHAIFSIHLHSFWFLLFLVVLILDRIFNTDFFDGWGWFIGFVYLWAALRNTYVQGWGKSFLKASLLSISYLVAVCITFAGFILLLLGLIL